MSGPHPSYGPGPADGQGGGSPYGAPGDYSAQSSAAAGPVAGAPAVAPGGYGSPHGGGGYGPPPNHGGGPAYGPPTGQGPGYGPGYGAAPGYGGGPYGGGYGAPAYGAGPGQGIPPGASGSVDVVGTRVGQYIVDALITAVPLIVLLILSGVLAAASYDSAVLGLVAGLVYFVAWLAALASGFLVYAWWPSTHGGQTPGMKWLGLKVVREEDGGEPTLGQHALRWLLFIVDGMVAGLVGLVIMSTSQRKQRLGDMAAHTLVVRV